jgi:hypothetical protein
MKFKWASGYQQPDMSRVMIGQSIAKRKVNRTTGRADA